MALAKDSSTLLGKHNDGREGAILTKVAQGELVGIPFYNVALSAGPSASAAYSSLGFDNPTPGKPITLSVPASTTAYAYLRTQLWGRMFGIRMRRHFASALPNMTFIVDGEPIAMRQLNTRLDTVPFTYGGFDSNSYWLLAEDLPHDGPHTVTVLLTGNASTTASVVLFGWLAEKSKGYGAYPADIGQAFTTQTLSTTATAIASSGNSVSELTFNNTGATPRVVSFMVGATVLRQFLLAAAGADGCTQTVTFKRAFTGTAYTVKQDAGTDVVMSWMNEGFTQ